MDTNQMVDRALTQAREMQKNVADALGKGAENMQPLLRESMSNAQALQETLLKHAQETAPFVQEQTQRALGHVQEFLKMGAQAVAASANQAREYAQKMMEQSRESMDATEEAMGKRPGSDAP